VSIPDWVQIIRTEYSEIPGLNLTHPQVERLWGLDSATSDTVLKVLVGSGFLRPQSPMRIFVPTFVKPFTCETERATPTAQSLRTACLVRERECAAAQKI
jgi:hypothetical protein